jgi:hypothetical protein
MPSRVEKVGWIQLCAKIVSAMCLSEFLFSTFKENVLLSGMEKGT